MRHRYPAARESQPTTEGAAVLHITTTDVILSIAAATRYSADPKAYADAVQHLPAETLLAMGPSIDAFMDRCETPDVLEAFAPSMRALDEARRRALHDRAEWLRATTALARELDRPLP